MDASKLSTLLDLAGEIYGQEGGYWIKIEARRVAVSPEVPHGVRYSLTLHDADNRWVIGFDNAHALPVRKGFKARRLVYDHWHPDGREIALYEFSSADQLLGDFFAEVDRVLKSRGVIP